MSFKIGNRDIGPGNPPLVIAEIGINHGGDVSRAVKLVEAASLIGCECVKFQCHIPDEEMLNDGSVLWNTVSKCSLSEEEERYIRQYVESKGMIYLCTPFSFSAVDRLERLGVQWYKIGSGEFSNPVFIEYVAGKGKPVVISTGNVGMDEIYNVEDIFIKKGVPYALLHSVCKYPTLYEEVNLGKIDLMKRSCCTNTIGLSDHMSSIWTSIAAVSLGACIIEKHFVDEYDPELADGCVSISGFHMGVLIGAVNNIYLAMKDIGDSKVDECFTHSVVAKREIKKGEIITFTNCTTKRPGTGEIKAVDFAKVVGRKASKNIGKNEQLRWVHFE
jgi:N-acetylneuraminate synthase